YWIADAVCDFFFFYEEPFLDLLLFDVPAHEIYTRSVVLGLFCIFGLILLKVVIKRQGSEQKRQEEHKKVKQYLNIAGVMIVVIDADQKVRLINKKGCEVLGYEEHEIIGKNWFDNFLPERIKTEVRGIFNTLMAGKIKPVKNVEGLIITKRGEERFIAWHNSVLKDEKGKIISILSSGEDITERKHIDNKLRESEEQLRTILNSSPDMIMQVDTNMKILWANKTALNMNPKAIGQACFKAFAGNEEPCPGCPCKRALKTGQIEIGTKYQPAIKGIQGESYWEDIGVPLKDGNGKIVSLIEIARNVTERKQMENNLWIKDYAIASSNNAIGFCDLEGKITYVNSSYLAMWGYDDEREVLGKSIEGFSLKETDAQKVIKAMQNKGSWIGESIARKKDGSAFHVQISASMVKDKNDKPLSMMASFIDITQCKLAEKALRDSEQKYSTLVEQAMDGVCIVQEGVFKFANKAGASLLGYSPEKIIDIPFLEHIENGDKDKALQEYKAHLSGERPSAFFELKAITKDGTIKDLEITTHLIEYNGKPAVMVISREITERKKMEEELRKMQKLESLGVLAGGIAHDFNNLLTSVIGNLSLIELYAKTGGNIFEVLEETKRASQQTKHLTNQLLTFAKGGEPIKTVASMAKLLKETAHLALSGSKTKCELTLPEDLWQAEVDEGQINQVINNLVINADQAMAGGGTIRIKAENVMVSKKENLPLKEGKYIKISIEDQGTGIKKEFLPKIFDPYFTTKQAGSGLGLAISYSIIKKHEGHITVESEIGEGTTFTIFLPAFEKESFTVEDIEEEYLHKGKGKILFMDDKKNIRDMVQHMLNYLGYEAELVADGAEAIEAYEKTKASGQRFEAAILDLTVPGGMGGIETIGKLREIDPEVKAIVSSGYAHEPILSEYEKYGFKGVIIKPYEIKELGDVLHGVLHKVRMMK
ncbi:MAG: PAS domain S-box protein, partial [Deltaproteobacteria bacterium]|nr:PAS domain S-box protein [Deltaproteobacteria bacterium]